MIKGQKPGTSVVRTRCEGRTALLRYPAKPSTGETGKFSYYMLFDGEQIARFLFIDNGDKVEDIAHAFFNGFSRALDMKVKV